MLRPIKIISFNLKVNLGPRLCNCHLFQSGELLRLQRRGQYLPLTLSLEGQASLLTLNTPPHLLNLLIQHPEKFLLALRSVNAEKRGEGREEVKDEEEGEAANTS